MGIAVVAVDVDVAGQSGADVSDFCSFLGGPGVFEPVDYVVDV